MGSVCKVASFGGSETLLNAGGDLIAIFTKPLLLTVKHADRGFKELVSRLVRTPRLVNFGHGQFAYCKLIYARVISRPMLLRFAEKHPDALAPLMNWYRITRGAEWNSLAEVRKDFAHADGVGRRTVFNIHGNHYRLIARVNYRTQRVFILHILTHADYSKGAWKR